MTNNLYNQYNFMIRTGKYYPDENIKHNNEYWYFEKYNNKGNRTYYEDSEGEWVKQMYNEKGYCLYYEYSSGYWEKLHNGNVIESGNYNDQHI